MSNATRRDTNTLAFQIVQQATGELDPNAGKDPAAVKRGKAGGAKGGPARAKKLTATKRSAIAKKAAASRWKQKN